MNLHKALMAFGLLLLPLSTMANGLDAPAGPIILTVSGEISVTNADDKAAFDRRLLARLPPTTIETSTIWTEGVQTFTGVSLHTLLDELDARGNQIHAHAVNDYMVTIPIEDAKENGPIVAYLRNGEIMSLRDKGPLWIIYPFDSDQDFRTETIYARSIWQLDRLEVVK